MITNLWGKLELYCGNGHEEKMELKEKRAGIFYECPVCQNSFSLKDVEKLFEKIEEVETQADLNDEFLDIKNMSLVVGHCRYKILDNGDKVKISGINKKALVYGKKG